MGDGEAARERQPPRRHGLRLVHLAEHRPAADPVARRRPPTSRPRTSATSCTGTTEGPLDYNQFGGYTLVARTSSAPWRQGGLERETTQQAVARASWRWRRTTSRTSTRPTPRSTRTRPRSWTTSQSPDILSLEEIQDNNGAKNDGTVAADQTVQKLIDAIVAAGGPAYEWRSIDPENNTDGGEPGGNIRQVFLFNPERVSFTDRAGGDATTAVGVTQGARQGGPDGLPRPHRPGQRGLDEQPQAARGRVRLPRQDGLRDRQPLRVEGRRPGPDLAVPAAGAQLGDPASPPGDRGEHLRQGDPRRAEERGRRHARRHQRLRVLRHDEAPGGRRRALVGDQVAAEERALHVRLPGQQPGPRPDPDQPVDPQGLRLRRTTACTSTRSSTTRSATTTRRCCGSGRNPVYG